MPIENFMRDNSPGHNAVLRAIAQAAEDANTTWHFEHTAVYTKLFIGDDAYPRALALSADEAAYLDGRIGVWGGYAMGPLVARDERAPADPDAGGGRLGAMVNKIDTTDANRADAAAWVVAQPPRLQLRA